MIDEHRRLNLQTTDNQKIEVEVNFSKNPNVKDCKVLRFIFVDKQFEVKRDDLTALLMAIGDVKTTKNLLPMKLTRVHKLERRLGMDFTASKDYRKGETIHIEAPWIDEVPTEEEVYAGALKRKSKIIDKVRKFIT